MSAPDGSRGRAAGGADLMSVKRGDTSPAGSRQVAPNAGKVTYLRGFYFYFLSQPSV